MLNAETARATARKARTDAEGLSAFEAQQLRSVLREVAEAAHRGRTALEVGFTLAKAVADRLVALGYKTDVPARTAYIIVSWGPL